MSSSVLTMNRIGVRCVYRTNCHNILSPRPDRRSLSISTNEKCLHNQKYCRDLVEKHDYENFLCTLLLKGITRRNAFTIRAFNVEIAKIGTLTSEEQMRKIKLKFWHDSIDRCFDKNDKSYVSDHPVLSELKYLADNFKLTKTYFKRLVNARQKPPNQQFVTIADIEEYADQTVSCVYYLLLESCRAKDINLDHVASHLGKAQGITNLLRATPFTQRNEAVNIPQEILLKYGVSQERLLRGKNMDKGVEECIFEVATIAYQHLQKARNLNQHVPRNLKSLFLPAVSVERYLERLRRANFRLANPFLLQRDSFLPLVLYWNNIRAVY